MVSVRYRHLDFLFLVGLSNGGNKTITYIHDRENNGPRDNGHNTTGKHKHLQTHTESKPHN